MSVLGTHLYQCTSWRCCERLHSVSVNFFWRLFNAFAHFIMGEHTSPHSAKCSAVFEQKRHDPYAPSSLFTQSHPKGLCFPGWRKASKETFCWWGRGRTKNSRSTKRRRNQPFQKLFWAVKKHLDWCTASSGEYFEVTEWGDKWRHQWKGEGNEEVEYLRRAVFQQRGRTSAKVLRHGWRIAERSVRLEWSQ